MDHALQIATLSMPALRECRFPSDESGSAFERDVAGRTMLAALGLRMLALLVEHGYDLRSGCLLVPEEEPAVELVGRLGKTVASWELFALDTGALLDRAVADGARYGLDWSAEPISLEASAAQLELLGRSLSAPEVE